MKLHGLSFISSVIDFSRRKRSQWSGKRFCEERELELDLKMWGKNQGVPGRDKGGSVVETECNEESHRKETGAWSWFGWLVGTLRVESRYWGKRNSRSREIAVVGGKTGWVSLGVWGVDNWNLGAEGWLQFEFELLRAYILQCALLNTPGSHDGEQEAWQSAVSRKPEMWHSVQYSATF